ncbi:hypothetical protein P7C73_g3887, partial [Tremellales sp. Uapishka_1]
MSTAQHVQLGTIAIDLQQEAQPSSIVAQPWTPVDLEYLRNIVALKIENAPVADDLTYLENLAIPDLLADVLADEGLDAMATCRRDKNYLFVRISILPSDAAGSRWRRTGPSHPQREKTLKLLFEMLQGSWDGGGERLLKLKDEDLMRMPDVYAAMPSPVPFSFQPTSNLLDQDLHHRLEEQDNPEQVKTEMYPYQHRSVAKMLQNETQPGRMMDPQYTQFQEAGTDAAYYVNVSTWDVKKDPGWYELPRGGILCEQMGVGKTLMCLALIVSTLHQPCLPSPDALNISPVTTYSALSTDPSRPMAELRRRIAFPKSKTNLSLPSLTEICANIISTEDPSAQHQPNVPYTLLPLLNRSTLYYQYPLEDECARWAKRYVKETKAKRMWLANTTLIVVPALLVDQWNKEVGKHLEIGAVNIMTVDEKKEDLPEIEELIKYDIVLMSVSRFAAEYSSRKYGNEDKPSVLMEARWKRIIIDEGHIAHNQTSHAMLLAMALSVERRWAVTGSSLRSDFGFLHMLTITTAPTRNLWGLDSGAPDANVTSARWTEAEIDDATRIGAIVAGFLGCQPFRSESKFQNMVTAPLRPSSGPSFGAVRRIKAIMEALMVRHRYVIYNHKIKLIRPSPDDTAKLPLCEIKTVLLDFDPMQRLSYNALVAIILSNVTTSDGTDRDYLLHANNTDSFNIVVQNMHAACSWFSAPDMDAEGCIERTRAYLEEDARTGNLTDEKRAVLKELIGHLETAVANQTWREWMFHGIAVPFDASELEVDVNQAWSDSRDSDSSLVASDCLLHIRQENKNGSTVGQIIKTGLDRRRWKEKKLEEEKEKRAKVKQVKSKDTISHAPTLGSNSAVKNAGKQVRKASKNAKKATQDPAETAESPSKKKEKDQPVLDPSLPPPLPSTIQTFSRSSKINYIVEAILSAPADKFVIFGDNNELGLVTEALDLIDVKSSFVGVRVDQSTREQALRLFNTQVEYRVCLLELKLAARGLNLVSANRMIFLAPIWSKDVREQAIKRVHRLGQTRASTVEILVMRDTFEEDVANRASTLGTVMDEKLYTRALVENPRFALSEKTPTKRFTIHLVDNDEKSPVASPLPKTPTSGLGTVATSGIRVASPYDYLKDVGPFEAESGEAPGGSAQSIAFGDYGQSVIGLKRSAAKEDGKGKKKARMA